MKRILIASLYFIAIAGIIFLMGFSQKTHRERVCPKVDINIDYGKREFASDIMLISSDIKQAISLNFDSIKGKQNTEFSIENIEKTLAKNNFVKEIDVYQEINGKINIRLTQRRPIMRIYGSSGNSFYIDESGMAIPIKPGYPARVLIISGRINDILFNGEGIDLLDSKNDSLPGINLLRNLYYIGKYIDNDDFLRKEITQIDIRSKNQIILIPLVGRHIIEMQSFANYDQKLKKLKIFYKNGLSQGGWGRYNKINIEFRNQIVCTKN